MKKTTIPRFLAILFVTTCSYAQVEPMPSITDTTTIQQWSIRSSDSTLSRALARWATTGTPPISWEAEKDFPAINAVYRGTYLGAVEQVMQDTARSQYPLHACVYANVVRILHTSQSCTR